MQGLALARSERRNIPTNLAAIPGAAIQDRTKRSGNGQAIGYHHPSQSQIGVVGNIERISEQSSWEY